MTADLFWACLVLLPGLLVAVGWLAVDLWDGRAERRREETRARAMRQHPSSGRWRPVEDRDEWGAR